MNIRQLCDEDGIINSRYLAKFLIELNRRREEKKVEPEPTEEVIKHRPKFLKIGRFTT